MGRDRRDQHRDGVAAALDSGGLQRIEAGRRLLAELRAAYEAPEAAQERGRAARGAMFPGGSAEDGPDAMLSLVLGMALVRAGRATTSRGVHRQLEKTLAEAAERRGLSAAALMDGLLPDHGLSRTGTAELAPGWTMRLDDRTGAVLAGPHGAAEPDGATEALADLRVTAALARTQTEAMFGALRELHVADFLENYLRHPVRAWLATRLVWQYITLDGGGPMITGFPDRSGQAVRTPDGTLPVPVSPTGTRWPAAGSTS